MKYYGGSATVKKKTLSNNAMPLSENTKVYLSIVVKPFARNLRKKNDCPHTYTPASTAVTRDFIPYVEALNECHTLSRSRGTPIDRNTRNASFLSFLSPSIPSLQRGTTIETLAGRCCHRCRYYRHLLPRMVSLFLFLFLLLPLPLPLRWESEGAPGLRRKRPRYS